MRVVLDTNIWISGLLLPKSTAGQIITAWQQNRFNVVISQPILAEIKKVLSYPKIQKRLRWEENKINQYLLLLTFFAEKIQLKKEDIKIKVLKDADDTPILATLITSQADYLVTGDNDLLCLKQDYPIITLAEFYRIIN
jgi:putative PIN family toxin of toxin-antitoxin system